MEEAKTYNFTPNLRPIFKNCDRNRYLKYEREKEITIDVWQSPFALNQRSPSKNSLISAWKILLSATNSLTLIFILFVSSFA